MPVTVTSKESDFKSKESVLNAAEGIKVTVTKNGPYLVKGAVPMARQTIVSDAQGESREWSEGERFETNETYALCRCGQSANKPFCDGSHVRVEFDGTETASTEPYAVQATEQVGPSLTLYDAQSLCAFARFCDVAGQVWNLVEQDGARAAAMTAQEAGLCPSGRLVVRNHHDNSDIEPEFSPSIGIVADPAQGVAGPIWVRGGITVVSADNETYEVRNRVTLCRCGASANKPFCDASHASIGFTE
jgi:CDGSH-type Zn-finger protein